MSTEATPSKANPFSILRYLFRRVGFRQRVFISPMICSFIASCLEALSMGLLFPAVLGLISGDFSFLQDWHLVERLGINAETLENSYGMLLLVASALLVVTMLRSLFIFAGQLLMSREAHELNYQVRKALFARYLEFGKLFYDKHNTGRMFHVLTEIAARSGILCWQLYNSAFCILTLIAYFAIMAWLSLPLALLVSLVLPALYFSLRKIMASTESSSVAAMSELVTAVKGIQNTLTNIGLVKAYCAEERESARFSEIAHTISYLQYKIDTHKLKVSPIQEVIVLVFLLALVALSLGVTGSDKTSVATLMIFIVILRRAGAQINTLGNSWQMFSAMTGELRELHTYFQTTETHAIADGSETATSFDNEITFNDVHFLYAGSNSGIQGVSFSIKKGQTLALVGATGAGKSTCLNLMMRFYDPDSGSIMLDGKDIRSFTRKSWRNLIALVSQDPYLFHDSLKANLCYGLADEPDEATILSALKMACLDDVVANLPQGIETPIGDRGIQLSGGERQRLAIARALLKGAQIILLDEATSALDSKTEKEIQLALSVLLEGKTVLSVAHRLSTIAHADKILVLDDGRLQESGNFDELMQSEGIFHDYWQRQVGAI